MSSCESTSLLEAIILFFGIADRFQKIIQYKEIKQKGPKLAV